MKTVAGWSARKRPTRDNWGNLRWTVYATKKGAQRVSSGRVYRVKIKINA